MRVEDAVRRVARRLGDRAERHRLLRREEVEGALEAAGYARVDHAHVPSEPLRAAVDHRYDRLERGLAHAAVHLKVDKRADHRVEPAARLDRVEAHHDDLELLVPRLVLVLDRAEVRRHRDARDALHHKLGCDRRLGPADVLLAEEKLPVEVGDIDGVHVDHVD
eukprot:884220-Prymnesium_polylepis.1